MTIIFDFDGTIADSFEVFLAALAATIRRTQPLTPEEIAHLRQLPTRALIKKLGIKSWQIPLLLLKGRREISARMDSVQPFEGMSEVLKILAAMHTIHIVSTNSSNNITRFLTRYELARYVKGVTGNIGLFGKAKSLQKLLRKENLVAADCLYIGDETRDIDAAKQAGIKCIAVAWGYSDARILAEHHPDALVKTPAQLLHELNGQKPASRCAL